MDYLGKDASKLDPGCCKIASESVIFLFTPTDIAGKSVWQNPSATEARKRVAFDFFLSWISQVYRSDEMSKGSDKGQMVLLPVMLVDENEILR